jgi:hypothetical protein
VDIAARVVAVIVRTIVTQKSPDPKPLGLTLMTMKQVLPSGGLAKAGLSQKNKRVAFLCDLARALGGEKY